MKRFIPFIVVGGVLVVILWFTSGKVTRARQQQQSELDQLTQ